MWDDETPACITRVVTQSLTARYSARELKVLIDHVKQGGQLRVDLRIS